MQKTAEHFNKAEELKEMGKREAEYHYKDQYNQLASEFKSQMKNVKQQY